MKNISGNIYNASKGVFEKGTLFFEAKIIQIVVDDSISSEVFILPGLIDAHVHIESSMLSPVEYSRESLRHGVVAAVTDPHEIANVCGLEGIHYMVESARLTPMKIFTGAPSCVPATDFETSGAIINSNEIEALFKNGDCFHLSEMMNFPGVLYDSPEVLRKIEIAKYYKKCIDGHAPKLSGKDLAKYFNSGISTDHECTTIEEAFEKISLGMKIMLRESSASKDFDNLISLIELAPKSVMFCTDDCHPNDLEKGYIEKLFRKAIHKKISINNIIAGASINAIEHYQLPVGYLRENDWADFIVVDNLNDFSILKTFINGEEIFDGNEVYLENFQLKKINNFYINKISELDIAVRRKMDKKLNVISIVPDSLLTNHLVFENFINSKNEFINSDNLNDILKIVVLNRYSESKPTVGFIKGFGLTKGAFGGSVAHDSHNIIVVGTSDELIVRAIKIIQKEQGGLIATDGSSDYFMALPIAGLMSDKPCYIVAEEYEHITNAVRRFGCKLVSPYMTLAFMALLVIPELKIGDRGLFDFSSFSIIDLQS